MNRRNSWMLRNARVARGPRRAVRVDLAVEGGQIAAVGPRLRRRPGAAELDLAGRLVLPGLINAHDHLQYSLFPRLGRGPYRDASAWARDIYRPAESPVAEHRAVPERVRCAWGALQNLLCGVTTVAHHDPRRREFDGAFPLRVARLGWSHSLKFSRELARDYARTEKGRAFAVHCAESVAPEGRSELVELARQGVLGSRTVLVHGVALGAAEIALVRRRRAALVWCPTSNLFILGRTLGPAALASGVPIALGTDSALSGPEDLLEELRAARRVGRVSPERLYAMVTTTAARVLRLDPGAGRIAPGGPADLLVIRDRGLAPASALCALTPREIELVLVAGDVKAAAPDAAARLPAAARRGLRLLAFEDGRRVRVRAGVGRLLRTATAALGPGLRLAGKALQVAP